MSAVLQSLRSKTAFPFTMLAMLLVDEVRMKATARAIHPCRTQGKGEGALSAKPSRPAKREQRSRARPRAVGRAGTRVGAVLRDEQPISLRSLPLQFFRMLA